MSTESNKAIVVRLMQEFFNNRNEALWDELAHPDVVIHGVSDHMRGVNEVRHFYARLFAAFDPWHTTIEDIIAEGDKVVVRLTETGTMTESFMGMPPTGKSFTLDAVQICHLVDGKLAEMWGFRDSGSQMRQLGLAPGPAQ
jgi:steroid delta-isomerase-like uncharacterized protein